MQTLKVLLKDKYVVVILLMVVTMVIGYKVSEYQYKEQQAIQQKWHEQGQKAKENTKWKIEHYGTIPAYRD